MILLSKIVIKEKENISYMRVVNNFEDKKLVNLWNVDFFNNKKTITIKRYKNIDNKNIINKIHLEEIDNFPI